MYSVPAPVNSLIYVTQRESADAKEEFVVDAIVLQVSLRVPQRRMERVRRCHARPMKKSRMYQWSINTRSIYHLLSRAFGQRVAIAEIVDFNISDVVAICDVHLTINYTCAITSTRRAWRG